MQLTSLLQSTQHSRQDSEAPALDPDERQAMWGIGGCRGTALGSIGSSNSGRGQRQQQRAAVCQEDWGLATQKQESDGVELGSTGRRHPVGLEAVGREARAARRSPEQGCICHNAREERT
ncbi:hypothetical protein L7F22_063828 [Adiantum nelumboides]|nr:hypothetical protein [Adiantum nelumboides]